MTKIKLDGVFVTHAQVIMHARELDEWYDRNWVHDFSGAIMVLIKKGYAVNMRRNELAIVRAQDVSDLQQTVDRLLESIAALKMENMMLKESQRLIPIEEQPPKEGEYVLVRYGDSKIYGIDFYIDGQWDTKGVLSDNATHWMRLPD